MSEMLQTLYGYQAWANNDLLDKLALLDGATQAAERKTALRLISHYHVVAEIFAAHLTSTDHGYTSDNTTETPSLDELRAAVAATDRWYQDYVRTASPEMLTEAVAFSFTDGDKGRMTKQEMLLHVALHSAVHRGEVCRILWQLKVMPPWDTLAVYLHQSEPARRQQRTAAHVSG
ncbi:MULTISPECIES: DinB family protein [unclassified Bosea (in: a-proteobacteria)]|uniref:DinB family protein n=1 Tax=unclassified Bosea (in: a-proteobacteria) TaxID=2653178 RepID=UPI000F759ADD|nr:MULTISPECIES: DinB family protein [unclassified Bosea (in: a-proteobacteria)]AZO76388.1 damage-inducible protein DinB [Bosea sp. Tri-49]RXT26315.1 damage-inducible protein DinB [Bosea sp. Tri-39]RXT31556.1 damage-inducible protein DinB [Bosea sp. Tri-54]